MLYAEVAVHTDAPYRHAFTYSVPPDLALSPGQGVIVPFGPRKLQGVVLALSDVTAFDGDVRPVQQVATELPSLLPHQIALARWLAERYLSPLFACVALMLPAGVGRQARCWLVPAEQSEPETADQRLLLAAVRESAPVDFEHLRRQVRVPNFARVVDQLVRFGALRREYGLTEPGVSPRSERHLRLTPAAALDDASPLVARLQRQGGNATLRSLRHLPDWSEADLRVLVDAGLAEEIDVRVERDPLAGHDQQPHAAAVLTPAQTEALHRIVGADGGADSGRPRVSLLHGVTGSGKTEVYLAAVESVLGRGKQAIVLVPEISLTPQLIDRFAGRFPNRVAVLHSELTAGQRFDQWHAVRNVRYDVVIGSRSALFAPVPQLGLIVLDEEHEWTYKQQERQPRYHARDVAERLAMLTNARLVLGSATPDVVSYARARRGRYQLLELRDRVQPVASGDGWKPESLPSVQVVDLARELREGNTSIFSRALADALTETLERGEQAILFLNRRGSANFLLCRDCGHVPSCRRCAISLTYHADSQRLVCHQCNRSRRVPTRCPRCPSTRIRFLGVGTQRVEEEVRRRFPQARVLRWDRDTVRRGDEHMDMYDRLKRGEADVLVGTQMVAKGLDLPRVTLVGVINADTSLNVPDFRSGERAFQLLTQVAGRAGRRDRPGQVIVQTYAPSHYAVQSAARHDYQAFFSQEIEYRRRGLYPPFARLTRLVYAHQSRWQAEREARRLTSVLRQTIESESLVGSQVVGPTPCLIARVRGRWRWQILLRCADPAALLGETNLPAGWSVDVDPQSNF